MATPLARAPLGGLDETRLHQLMSKKNMQNGFVPTPTSLKRRREIDSDPAFDPENVDPTTFSPKKAKTGSTPLAKPQNFVLKSTASGPALTPTTRQLITPKRLQKNAQKISPVSFSAPATAPAGRSPTKSSKRAGILSKKRSYTRFDPPKFALDNSPFSLDAALSCSLGNKPKSSRSSKKAVCSVDESTASGWFFQIHEDSPDDHASNMIEHSTCILDLSDDEEKRRREVEERGKENIPPADYAGPGPTRRDAMTDDTRMPLGMLEASEFYCAGMDANSFVVVDEGDEKNSSNIVQTNNADSIPDPSPTDAVSTGQDVWRQILSKVESKTAESLTCVSCVNSTTTVDTQLEVQSSQEPPVEIWESESAKGDESEVPEAITTTTPLHESIAAIEAREGAAIDALERN